MSNTVVLVLTALLALGVLGWSPWCIWHIARHTPTRQGALANVLGCVAGTVLLGIILPAVLKGALGPLPIWLGYAGLAVTAASVLGWRWSALPHPGRASHPGLVISSCLLVVILAVASVAVT